MRLASLVLHMGKYFTFCGVYYLGSCSSSLLHYMLVLLLFGVLDSTQMIVDHIRIVDK